MKCPECGLEMIHTLTHFECACGYNTKPKKEDKKMSYADEQKKMIEEIAKKYFTLDYIQPPDRSGYFYVYVKEKFLDFEKLQNFDKEIGKKGWYILSLVSQSRDRIAIRCKT